MIFKDFDCKKHPIKNVIIAELHVIDDFNVNLLIENDVLISKDMTVDLNRRKLIINNCEGLKISIKMKARKNFHVKRIIRARQAYIIMLDEITEISITWRGRNLSNDRDLLFESNCSHYLKHEEDLYASIVDVSFNKILVKNTTEISITLVKRMQLNTVIEYNQIECYLIMFDENHKTIENWLKRRSWKRQIDATTVMITIYSAMITKAMINSFKSTSFSFTKTSSASITSSTSWSETSLSINEISQINFNFEHTLFNEVTVYKNNSIKIHLNDLIHHYQNVFVDFDQTIDIFEKKWMFINLKPDVISKPNKVYSLKLKNKTVLNDTFDKFHAQEKLHWSTQPISFSYPTFVIWKDLFNEEWKERVIIDIRGLNDIIESNNYSLFLQSEIIITVTEYDYIFIVNVVLWFYQFNVKRSDRFKFIVISYRNQEQFNVILMSYKKSSFYVQRQTDKLLRSYKKFIWIYVNDIIIYSRTLKEHLNHLIIIFQLFRNKRVNLTSTKFYLNYSSVILLSQRINNLNMFIFAKKIIAITSLRFSYILQDLEIFLNLIEWLRSSISYYAQRASSLQKRKILLIKTIFANKEKDSVRKKIAINARYKLNELKIIAFKNLQKIFISSIFLIHYNKLRRLYVDLNAFKQWDFAAMIYHVLNNLSNDITFSRIAMQSIMFLNKCLNDAEKNYWSIELKIADII